MSQQDSSFKIPDPPHGVKAIPWRLPIWIYRLKLGWLLGHRLLLLTHTGRISGKPRQAVVEVVQYKKETNTHYVVSGFGEKAQWFQNILKSPEVTLRVGGGQFKAIAERLSPDEAQKVFEDYQRRHPNALKNLSKLIGYELGSDKENIRSFARTIPVIAFHPQE